MNEKKNTWLDILFLVIGGLVLVMLFMPAQYTGWRIAAYIGVGIFLAYLVIREVRRKRREKKEEKAPEERNDKE